jgi:uncharacterized protein (TIGR02246 family)
MEPRSPEDWWPLFQGAMRQGDLEAVMALYESGAAFANADGSVRLGDAELRRQFEPLVNARADFEVTIKKIVQSADVALLHSEYRTTRPQEQSGYALEVLRRQADGRWLLAIGDPFTLPPQSAESHAPPFRNARVSRPPWR